MLRNDGVAFTCQDHHPYICGVFDDENDLKSLINDRIDELKWFYENSIDPAAPEYIRIIVKYLCENDQNIFEETSDLYRLFGVEYSTYLCSDDQEVISILHKLDKAINQEFCRVRTSDVKHGGTSNDIYFRISSIGFNWFDIIWDFVNKNKNFISSVTIARDGAARDFSMQQCYKISGLELNHIDVDDFLTLKGNPIIEKLNHTPEKFESIEKNLAWDIENILTTCYKGKGQRRNHI